MSSALPGLRDAATTLHDAADRRNLPVLYINHSYDDWRSDRATFRENAESSSQAMLPKIGLSHLIGTGVAADICLLFPRADTHMGNFKYG